MPSKGRIELFLRGIPLADIARKAEVDKAYVSRCLNGKQKPSRKLIEAACEVTKLSVEALFEVKDEQNL